MRELPMRVKQTKIDKSLELINALAMQQQIALKACYGLLKGKRDYQDGHRSSLRGLPGHL